MDDSGVNGLRCPEPNRAVSLCFALYACVLVNLFFFFSIGKLPILIKKNFILTYGKLC